jgi:hypothetical protein
MLITPIATVLAAESEVGGIVRRLWTAVLIGWLAFVANHLRTAALENREPRVGDLERVARHSGNSVWFRAPRRASETATGFSVILDG